MRISKRTSERRGTLCSVKVSRVRMLAIIRGSAAFFAPEMGMMPSSGRPPVILIRSMISFSLSRLLRRIARGGGGFMARSTGRRLPPGVRPMLRPTAALGLPAFQIFTQSCRGSFKSRFPNVFWHLGQEKCKNKEGNSLNALNHRKVCAG